MKKIFCCLLMAVMLSACGGENKKSESSKKRVGDIVMVDGEFGVVFAVTTDGQHGKAMSVSQTECSWGNAKHWCANFGQGWRLPTEDELRVIYGNKTIINSALRTNGYTTLTNSFHWSSEFAGGHYACGFDMDCGLSIVNIRFNELCVRAVSAF